MGADRQHRLGLRLTGLNAALYAGLFPAGDSDTGPTRQPAYHTSKGAVLYMTRDLAIAFAPWGITVNAISPAMSLTEQSKGIVSDEVVRRLSEMTPLGRFGEAREIGYAARFLASDEAAFITGAELRVDGGWSAWRRCPPSRSRWTPTLTSRKARSGIRSRSRCSGSTSS